MAIDSGTTLYKQSIETTLQGPIKIVNIFESMCSARNGRMGFGAGYVGEISPQRISMYKIISQ